MATGTRLDLTHLLSSVSLCSRASLALRGVLAACLRRVAAGAVVAVQAATVPQRGDCGLLWGDTHVHTRNPVAAYATGLGSADIDSAYRFARGIPVVFPKTLDLPTALRERAWSSPVWYRL